VSLAEAFLADTHFSDEPELAVTSKENRLFEVQVSHSSRPLKVTLVWTDKPSEIVDSGSSGLSSLHNKLLLAVGDRNGQLTCSNTPKNNAQRIIIEQPTAGPYTIQVQGLNIEAHSPSVPRTASNQNSYQDFALVVSNVASLTLVGGE
jgi:hypothetical protein